MPVEIENLIFLIRGKVYVFFQLRDKIITEYVEYTKKSIKFALVIGVGIRYNVLISN